MEVSELSASELTSTSDAMEWLLESECSNNVLLGFARRDDKVQVTRFFVVRGTKVTGVAMWTDGFPVLLGTPISVEAAFSAEIKFKFRYSAT